MENAASDAATDPRRSFLDAPGEMARRIREFDWSSTKLGPVESWPQSLKTSLRIMLLSRQPVWVGWGEDLTYFYNDAYHSIIGGKHPWAHGRPTREVWSEIWDVIDPMLRTALEGDEGTYVEDQLLIMERNGYPEETYYTFSYSPIPDDEGRPGGIFCANTDDTQRVIGQRELSLLRDLASRTAKCETAEAACASSAAALATNLADLPFAVIYTADEDAATFTLGGASGIEPGHRLAPSTISSEGEMPYPFVSVLQTGEASEIVSLSGEDRPIGAWDVAPDKAVVLPLVAAGETTTASVLVVGLNPHRMLDDGYRGFLGLVAGQIGAAISDAIAAERERKNAEALAELDRAKTAFFANVSHEFRTPLTLMIGPLEDTLAGAHGALSPETRRELEVVHSNSLRLLKLVNTLLDFSRIEAGRTQACFEPTDLQTYTAELASTFRSAVEREGIRFVVECEPLSGTAYVDRDMWEKIVLNLLSNAFKFTMRGEIRITLRETDGSAELCITDTGAGIPKAAMPHLFERFYRVEGARGRTHEGTGIGLALVGELAKLHGGRAWADSEEGRGSTFHVSIPLGREHLAEAQIKTGSSATESVVDKRTYVIEASGRSSEETLTVDGSDASDKPTILLADDNADMREYVDRLLSDRFHVVAVEDGVAALEAARRHRPDLVLTDVMMPRLDGFGLLSAIREDAELRSLPVVMLSARAGEESSVEGLAAGADDYLVKPFAARELLARVEVHVRMAQIRREAENALRKSEAAMAEAQRLAHVGSWEWSLDTDENVVSDELCRIFGLPEGEPIPRFSDQRGTLYPEASWDRLSQAIDAALSSGQGYYLELEAWRNREQIWVATRSEVVRNAVGEIIGLRGTIQDVTERRLAELEREQAASRWKLALDSAQMGWWHLDPATGEAICDARLADIFGIDRGTQRLADILPLLDARDRVRTEEAIAAALNPDNPKPYKIEFRVNRPDGLQVWVEAHGQAEFVGEGAARYAIGFSGTIADITERKTAEQMLERLVRERTAELTASNKELESFCYSVSHDLRSPARAVMGSAMILLEDYGQELPPEAKEKLLRQVTASRRMGQLIDDLLGLSRIGRTEISRETFDLSALAEQVTADAMARPDQSSARVEIQPALSAYGDPRLVRLVLQNLLENSLKFSRTDGTATVQIGSTASENGRAFFVRDNGIGIAPEFAEKIFEPFQRLHRDEEYEGTGIGLANVRRIIERHGGRVWTESREGEGATFLFTLPTADGA